MIKLFIDPGHGGSDPGAVGNGLLEKELTLDIAKRIRKYLDAHFTGHTVKMSRTIDQTVSLAERTKLANDWDADYYLSIHVNAGRGTGYEDYIYNRLSDDSNTAKIRNVMHETITGQIPTVVNRGKKKANFHVLRETKMSAMLTENLFIDTKADADKLKNRAFLDKLAKGHAEGLARVFELRRKTVPKTDANTLYRVVAGSFQNRSNALKRVNELEKAGFDSFIIVHKK